jgi:hypothetical protein
MVNSILSGAANLIRRCNRQIRQNNDACRDFIVTSVFFGVGAIAGFVLNTLYNGAVKRSFSGRGAILYTIIGAGAGILHASLCIIDFAYYFKSRENQLTK